MKKTIPLLVMLLAHTAIAAESSKYDTDMQFIINALESEAENTKAIIKSRCEIETYSQQRIGNMKITNQATYYPGNIRTLSVKNTENVGKAGVSEKMMARTYPYSLEFDGTPQNIVVKSLHIAENLQYPQSNKPPEVNGWTRFYIMFKSRNDADTALVKLKNIAELCL